MNAETPPSEEVDINWPAVIGCISIVILGIGLATLQDALAIRDRMLTQASQIEAAASQYKSRHDLYCEIQSMPPDLQKKMLEEVQSDTTLEAWEKSQLEDFVQASREEKNRIILGCKGRDIQKYMETKQKIDRLRIDAPQRTFADALIILGILGSIVALGLKFWRRLEH